MLLALCEGNPSQLDWNRTAIVVHRVNPWHGNIVQITGPLWNLGKIFIGLTYMLLLSFTDISYVFRSIIPNKISFIEYCLTHCIAPQELWNPMIKAVHSKFHGSGRHSKCNFLQDRANFHRCRACQINLIFFNTAFQVRWHVICITSMLTLTHDMWMTTHAQILFKTFEIAAVQVFCLHDGCISLQTNTCDQCHRV